MLLAGFGWAKPVPVTSRNLRKPRRDIALVSIAGPVSNMLIAIIFTLILRVAYRPILDFAFSSLASNSGDILNYRLEKGNKQDLWHAFFFGNKHLSSSDAVNDNREYSRKSKSYSCEKNG